MKTPDSTHTSPTALLAALLLAIGATTQSAEPEATLKDAFKDYFKVGTAINRSITTGNGFRRSAEEVAKDIALVKAQFNQIVPENEMKWMSVHPRPGKDGYDWTAADAFAEFGSKNNMELAGHTLVWHSQTPNWVFEGTSLPPGAKAEKPAGEEKKAAADPAAPTPAAATPPGAPPAPRSGPFGGGGGSVDSTSMDPARPVRNCSRECGSTSTPWSVATKER